MGILVLSCESTSPAATQENVTDYSYPVQEQRVIEHGNVHYIRNGFFKKKAQYPRNNQEIICQGKVKETGTSTVANIFLPDMASNVVNEYNWVGDIRYGTQEDKNVKIHFIIFQDDFIQYFPYVGGDPAAGNSPYIFKINQELCNDPVSSSGKDFIYPYKVAEYQAGNNSYAVYAVYEYLINQWAMYDSSYLNSVVRLMQKGQKFQIVGNDGVVAAELIDGFYFIYDNVPPEHFDNLRRCIGIVHAMVLMRS